MKKLPFLFLGLLVGVSLILRLKIILEKPFDPDEFAHMHTSWLITHGYLPYKDFYLGYPPSFHLMLSPFFLLLSPSQYVPLILRLFILAMFGVVLYLFYRIARLALTPFYSLLAILFMTTSVFLLERGVEVRPDALALFLWMLDAWIIYKMLKKIEPKLLALTGLLTGLAGVITQKSIYGTLFIGILLLFVYWPAIQKRKLRLLVKHGAIFLVCFVVPFVFVLLYFIVNNLVADIPDYLIRFPLTLGQIYHWDHPWYHLGIFKGFTETAYFTYLYKKSFLWMFETQAMWILSLGLFPLWTVAVFRRWKKIPDEKRYFFVFLTSGLTIFMIYLLVIAAKIPQYWYLPAPFVALALAFGLSEIVRRAPVLKYTFLPVVVLGMTLTSTAVWNAWSKDLVTNNNGRQLKVISEMLTRTSPTATVYDGIGAVIFRPDCYYFSMVLPNEIPQAIFKDVMEDFAAGRCDYVVEGLFNRMDGWSFGENNYIYTHFSQWADNQDVWERKK